MGISVQVIIQKYTIRKPCRNIPVRHLAERKLWKKDTQLQTAACFGPGISLFNNNNNRLIYIYVCLKSCCSINTFYIFSLDFFGDRFDARCKRDFLMADDRVLG